MCRVDRIRKVRRVEQGHDVRRVYIVRRLCGRRYAGYVVIWKISQADGIAAM